MANSQNRLLGGRLGTLLPAFLVIVLTVLPGCAAPNEAPDGRVIVSNEDKLIAYHWKTNERQTLVTFPYSPESVAVLPDPTQFVVVKGAEVALFDSKNGHEIVLGEYQNAGQPRASPDGTRCAWVATLKSGRTALVICDLASHATEVWANDSLAVTDVGPNWIEGTSALPRFLVSTKYCQIGVLSDAGKKFDEICMGELPLMLPSGTGFVYFHDDALWKGHLDRIAPKKVCRLPLTVGDANSCCVSPDGRYVVFKRIELMRIAIILGQPYHTADLIDVVNGKRREIEALGDCWGAWAWDLLPCEQNGSKG